jgi:hypothetical protein
MNTRSIQIIVVAIMPALIGPRPACAGQADSVSARDLYIEKAEPLMGLKCRLLLRNASGSFLPVKPDSIFHTNDHIRLELESNAPGYLYVIQQGSDSTWQVLFPSVEIHDNNNRVVAMQPVEVPRSEDFFFDETPGKERLFIVLARDPEPDLERLLKLVRAQRSGTAAAQPDDAMPSLVKSISTKMSGDLASRNLRVSRIDDQDPSPNARNALYVVNAEKSEGRVIAEVVLIHER